MIYEDILVYGEAGGLRISQHQSGELVNRQ
jgi:hypothetical protein